MKVYAPGKLILSGEHAVVYGKPALAMAVNRYVVATVSQERLPQILFDLSDLAHRSRLSVSALSRIKNKIKRKYHRFISGDFSIRDVLKEPFELAQFALGVIAESLNLSLPHGVRLHLTSDIPIGCGMGSSAATILSVMHAISMYLQMPLSHDAMYQLALDTENIQHGHSSGLDLRVIMQGGCLYVHGQERHARLAPTLPMYLVNTGTPATTTGECVEKVAPYFKSQVLGDEFAGVTMMMDKALQQSSSASLRDAIHQNHRLLSQIGVVPNKIQQFISQVEIMGGAAKICGAGAVSGDKGGSVLVVMEDKMALSTLCSQYEYHAVPIACESRGVHAV